MNVGSSRNKKVLIAQTSGDITQESEGKTMQSKEIFKLLFDCNKDTCKTFLNGIDIYQEEMEKTMNLYIDQAVTLPEKTKKAVKEWVSMYKIDFDNVKKLIDAHYRKIGIFFQMEIQESR